MADSVKNNGLISDHWPRFSLQVLSHESLTAHGGGHFEFGGLGGNLASE